MPFRENQGLSSIGEDMSLKGLGFSDEQTRRAREARAWGQSDQVPGILGIPDDSRLAREHAAGHLSPATKLTGGLFGLW